MQLASLARSVAVAAAATGLAAIGLGAGAFEGFQRSAEDVLFPRGDLDDRVVVVGIDAEALAATGESWPWPRGLQAQLVQAVHDAGATAIGVDVVFAEGSTEDGALAEVLAGIESVALAAVPSGLVEGDHGLLRAVTLAEPVADLAEHATVGHAVITEDPRDGVARSTPLVIDTSDGRFLPSLALALAAMAEGAQPVPIVRPTSVQVGSLAAPTTDYHQLRLSYAPGLEVAPGDHYLSASQVLDGDGLSRLEGRVVLIGVADPTLGDLHRTPMSKGSGLSGVFVQAQALNTLLTRSWVEPVSDLETLAWSALLAVVIVAVSQWLRLRWAPLAALAALSAYLTITSLRFDAGTVMDPVYPTATAAVALAGGLVLRYLVETRQRRRVSALFSRYVPATVAETLMGDSDRVAAVLDGERLHVAVLFCDLRGFTTLSRTLPAPDVRRLLDVFYRHATEPILERGGTVLQFIGDEVYAVFGAPLPTDGNERLALECACAIQAAQPVLADELDAMGLPPVRFGIGLNAGEGVAAEVGTAARSQYTVLGDVVNVASRLCSLADADGIVFSDAVRRRADDAPDIEDVGRLALKGVDEPMQVWAIGPTRNLVRG